MKQIFDDIYAKYHRPKYLGLDPLVCVRQFNSFDNREIAGLLAASLAYGRVEIIVRNINAAINIMGNDPARFVLNTSYKEKLKLFAGFKHRFNDGQDIAALLESVAAVIKKHGSLEKCFDECMKRGDNQLKKALSLFAGILKDNGRARCGDRSSFAYLLPSPDNGSACKRLVLYLRWMVRADDGIDLGVWTSVPTSCLIVPVDTHVAKIARSYGLTNRKSADWKMAEEITAALREFDQNDPVKYDFSMCHAGMVGIRE